MYSMMSCSGWGDYSILGGCSMAWFSFVIIVFLALIARRQCTDGFLAGTGFNIIGAFILGIGGNVLLTALTGNARWSLIVGIVGVVVGGYIFGLFFDMTGDSDGS